MSLPIAEYGILQDAAHKKADESLSGVKRIIAIHSGKGGVGKTFLTCNIAYALAELHGLSVGILDADVDCPNVTKFLGVNQSIYTKDKRFIPAMYRGVKILSTGLMNSSDNESSVESSNPILMRGPAKHRIILDLLTNTNWGALDILLIDLPPGTSDVPMSIFEFGKIDGVLFVTSPQKESLLDTKRSIAMCKQFGLHELGIVENMSGGVFGQNKAIELAHEFGILYLGNIPLSEQIFEANERGDIAFLLPGMEDAVRPIIDAVIGNDLS